MPWPEYPNTIIVLLLVWCLVGFVLLSRLERLWAVRVTPFYRLVEERFNVRPSPWLVLLLNVFIGLVLLWLAEGIGHLELTALCLWLAAYVVIRASFRGAGGAASPLLDEPQNDALRYPPLLRLFFSLLYGGAAIPAAFVLLAASVGLHRLMPLFQEQSYLNDAWFFVKGEHFPPFALAFWSLEHYLTLLLITVPYMFFVCLFPLLAADTLFHIAIQLWPRFYRYRLLRSYSCFTFDCLRLRDQQRIWSELETAANFQRLERTHKQGEALTAVVLWFIGGLAFVLAFDHYAKVYPDGIAVNRVASFAEVRYPWRAAHSVRLSAVRLGADSSFNVRVTLALKDGTEAKLWSYYVLSGRSNQAGREQGLASSSQMLRLLEILRTNNVPFYVRPLSPVQLELLNHYSDEEIKRSVTAVYNAFVGKREQIDQAREDGKEAL